MNGFLDLLIQYENLKQIEMNLEKRMVDGEETWVAAFTKDGAVHTCIETHYGLLYQKTCDVKTAKTVDYNRIRGYIDEFVTIIENEWEWKFDLESVEEEERDCVNIWELYIWFLSSRFSQLLYIIMILCLGYQAISIQCGNTYTIFRSNKKAWVLGRVLHLLFNVILLNLVILFST